MEVLLSQTLFHSRPRCLNIVENNVYFDILPVAAAHVTFIYCENAAQSLLVTVSGNMLKTFTFTYSLPISELLPFIIFCFVNIFAFLFLRLEAQSENLLVTLTSF